MKNLFKHYAKQQENKDGFFLALWNFAEVRWQLYSRRQKYWYKYFPCRPEISSCQLGQVFASNTINFLYWHQTLWFNQQMWNGKDILTWNNSAHDLFKFFFSQHKKISDKKYVPLIEKYLGATHRVRLACTGQTARARVSVRTRAAATLWTARVSAARAGRWVIIIISSL